MLQSRRRCFTILPGLLLVAAREEANMTEQFSETVMRFDSEPHHVNVAFSQHAGIYRLAVAHPGFVACMTAIAEGYKRMLPVAVTVRGQEIESVKMP
jgi:hypothetical protein